MHLLGHAIAYDTTTDKIITYNGYHLYVHPPEDFYNAIRSTADDYVYKYPNKDHASSQGLGAFGGLVFIPFSNKDSNDHYYSNTIIVYDLTKKKVVEELETSDVSEVEDCFFDNTGTLFVSDPMGGIFKTDCNAYSLGATGTPGTNTSTGGTNSKSNNIFISLITKINNDLADSLQSVMENFERNNSFAKLTYSTTEIDADTELKEKLQVVSNLSGTSEDNEDTNTIHPEKLKGTVLDKTGNPQTVYTTTTEIPYLLVSFDNLLLDRLSFTDIDFFGNSNTNSNWQDIRQLISKLTKAVLFICSALMLIMLIYRSIMLIVAVIQGNPNISTKSKEIMDNLFGCIAIIVFTYVLMALMIYFSKLILNIALNGNTSSFLVRLDVEDVYSFNTNFAGYFKYLSQDGSFLHSLGRLIANGLKLLLCFALAIRVILLGGLTAISPIAAINYMKKNSVEQEEEVNGIFHLGPLIKLYSRIVFEPVILGVFLIIFMRI